MNQNQNPYTQQDCIQTLESAMREIEQGIEQMNPNCRDLIIIFNPSGESVNLNHIRGEEATKYFVSLNTTSQIYNPPFLGNAKNDLIRYYHFKHLAKECPNVRIHIAYLIPSNQISDLYRLLNNDFLKLQQSNGLIIFFYDSPEDDCQSDSQTLKKLYIDQNDNPHDNEVCRFLSYLYEKNRIIHLTKQDIQDGNYIIDMFQSLENYYPKDLERLFQVKPACENMLVKFKEIFQEALNDEIQIVLSDIIYICSQQSNEMLQILLPSVKEFETTLKYLQLGIDKKDGLIQAIDKLYTSIGALQPCFCFDIFEQYMIIFEFFRQKPIGELLSVSFLNLKFTQVLNRNIQIQPIQAPDNFENQQQNQNHPQQNSQPYQIKQQQQPHPYQTLQPQQQCNSPFQPFKQQEPQPQPQEKSQQPHPYQTLQPQQQCNSPFQPFKQQEPQSQQFNQFNLEQPEQTECDFQNQFKNPSLQRNQAQQFQMNKEQQFKPSSNPSIQKVQNQTLKNQRNQGPIQLNQLNLEQKYQQIPQYSQNSSPQQKYQTLAQNFQTLPKPQQQNKQNQINQQTQQPQQQNIDLHSNIQELKDCQQQIQKIYQNLEEQIMKQNQQKQQVEQKEQFGDQLFKQLSQQQKFHFVMQIDVRLPKLNGLEFQNELKYNIRNIKYIIFIQSLCIIYTKTNNDDKYCRRVLISQMISFLESIILLFIQQMMV